ncbi:hypothetical protein K2P96_00105 [Patescibacteria group bacterium]|nr:hypothetical protein [Patescibacteria group bacterium]
MKKHRKHIWVAGVVATLVLALFFFVPIFFNTSTNYTQSGAVKGTEKDSPVKAMSKLFTPPVTPLDIAAYDKKMIELANNPPPPQPTSKIVTTKNKDGTVTKTTVVVPAKPAPVNIWPVKAPYPLPGALLPFDRIIAYYGNLYSKGMGVLGEYPENEMLAKLKAEVEKWQAADPATPTIPALHYIAVTAQGSPGESGKYRLRMPDSEIDKVIAMAAKINGIVFIDIQVGFSTLPEEIPRLEKYWKMPQVHMGIDPEFSMKTGIRPGKVVGTYDATDINYAITYLQKIVKENNLPPKILVIHRYTQKMVTNYQNIKPLPEVQIVMDMDGWGGKAKKEGTYRNFIYPEPVQFTGFKLFYKNDILTPGTVIMEPKDVLKLRPIPSYIQYQ